MKTVSDDLFRLVKSLNKSEKGYFKKFAAKNASGSKQNYIILFDAIDKMADYDENILRRTLKNESFVKQLPVYKVYLFNLILKSLNQYGAHDNSTNRIKELIENAKTLSLKALYKDALKMLKRAKEISYKYYNFTQLQDILILERNIIIVLPGKNIVETRKAIYDEQVAAINTQKKIFDYSWLSDQMVICVEQKGDFTEESQLKEMEKIMRSPYMSDFGSASNQTMQFYYYHTHLLYHIGLNDLESGREILKKEISSLEDNMHLIEDNPQNYSTALINLLLFSYLTKSRKDVLESIQKLNVLKRKLRNKVPLYMELQILFHSANTEMFIYRHTCDMKKGRATAKKIEMELPKYPYEIPRQLKISLLHNLVCFYIMDEKLDLALKLNNMVLNETGMGFKSDMHFLSKLLHMLIHFELGNFDLLEYSVNTTYKFFKGKKALHKAETIILNFFKEAFKSTDEELNDAYDELYYKLNKIDVDPHARNLFQMFDFLLWAESKAKNKKFIEVLKEKSL